MHVFISHASANARIAGTLAKALEAAQPNVTTFVASRPGDIRADGDWLRQIEKALQAADAYVIILTPESVLRPWVHFESGAAWFFGRPLIFTRIRTLSTDEIPLPINSRQIYALDDPEQFVAILQVLGLPVKNVDEWIPRLAQSAFEAVLTGDNEPAWEGVALQGMFYAWAGPLLRLKNCDPVPAPAGLLEQIRQRGLTPRWATSGNVGHHVERGLAQVFATDRELWRCAIMDRGRSLMVGNPNVPRAA